MTKYRSIRLRLLVTLALTVSAIIVALGLFSYQSRKAELNAQYQAERENLQRRLSINLANPVWNWDASTVELNLQAERTGIVVGIEVSKQAGAPPLAKLWQEEGQRFKASEETTAFPLFLKEEDSEREVGHITLVTSRRAMDMALQQLVYQRVFELLALLALVMGAFWWTVWRVVLKPLARLKSALVRASEVQSSDFTLALPEHTDDEFGDVVQTVDKIQHRLRADLKRAEVAQEEARSLYAEQVILTAQLEESRQLAEDSARSKGEFLANMSHEIRTPMNAIIGLSGLALRMDMPERLHDYLTKIKNSGEHLLGIINDILDFSKIESGKMDIEHVPFELNTVIDNLVNLVSDKSESKGLELVCTVNPDIPRMLIGDALRMGQVLINLANNAVKFTEQGEVRIQMDVQSRSDDTLVLLCEVHDTGIGLTPEQVSKLFQSFSQADASITRKYGGTGLGLTISKSLVEGMGGEIGVRSHYGQGSTFWFTAKLGIGSQEPLIARSVVDLHGSRVLVVDDNESAAQVLTHMLQAVGFEVLAVHSGAAALQTVRIADADNAPFAMVLLDWRMPVMDGLQTAQALQALPLKTMPKIIMLSAHRRDDVVREAAQVGIQHFLSKPVSSSVLVNNMMEVMGFQASGQQRLPTRTHSGHSEGQLRGILGARVLLVEDNEINQQVATELLASAGFAVEVAENGKIAVAQVQARVADGLPYDIVLMDMQMPVMDGVTASRLLRETLSTEQLPIVAMTANAMKADRDRCLDAGMNAVVTKPINPDDLWQALAQWVKPRAGLGQAPQAAAVPAASAGADTENQARATALLTSLQGIDGLDTAQGLLRTGHNAPFYVGMLRKMVKAQANSVQQMRQSLAQGDYATAERAAHTLKGVAGNLGAWAVQASANALETALRERHTGDGLQVCLDATEGVLQTFMGALLAIDGFQEARSVPAAGSNVDRAHAMAVLQQLIERVRDDDPSALALWEEHRTVLCSVLPNESAVADALQSFDFETALEGLQQAAAAAAAATAAA